jgi:putative NIF3 family GTP cyclohydrolase 1 type 2
MSFVQLTDFWCSYPEELADKAWDNVGLLVGNSDSEGEKKKPIVLVTNDLTYQVAMDAIEKGASVIVSYRKQHRFVFAS